MNKQNIMKKAVVLLFAALMVLSAEAAIANTGSNTLSTQPSNPTNSPKADLIWDNTIGVHGVSGGIIVSDLRPDGDATPADDFQLDAQKTVNHVVWQGGYFQVELAQGYKDYGWSWNIIFWNDDGTGEKPGGDPIYNETVDNETAVHSLWYTWINTTTGREYWVANYSADLPVPITFDAGVKYWITIQGVGAYPPQSCWSRHNDSVGGIKLHQAKFKGALWGYPDWVDLQVLMVDARPHDLNFQLWFGDSTPPETTIALNGTMQGGVYITDVTATLTATDVGTGVDYTKYQVDGGAWNTYSVPFVVTGNGNHTIVYYSVDKAGNEEAHKTATFTIKYPIEITIKGGFGITATIKNGGTGPLNGVAWTITLDGKLIFVGKTKSGTVDIPAGGQAAAKDLVIGFGKTNIAVSAAGTEATATGMVILFFVIGVK
jgi:hypothetical protein